MKVEIIGRGNVATHLMKALHDQVDLQMVNSRTLDGMRQNADIYIVSVSDDAIADVCSRISRNIQVSAIMAHTSGTTPLDAIRGLHPNTGVFYPLQTFSRNVELDYNEIPFLIEGSNENVCNSLDQVARLVSADVRRADSLTRRNIHIASVLSCNFVNHLWVLADSYLNSKGISFDIMQPLIKETVRKISRVSPYEAQTGPAVRHDLKTISSHCKQLEGNAELLSVYEALTDSIMRNHPNNGE